MPRNRSCGSYGPGHLMHWIQGKKSLEHGQPIIRVKVVAVHDDGRVEIEGQDLKPTKWYHDAGHLRSALCFDSRAEWKPKYHVLNVTRAARSTWPRWTRWSPANHPYTVDRPRPRGSSSNGRCGRTTATRVRRAGWLTWMPYRTATPVNRSLGTWCHCPPNYRRQDTADMLETTPWRDRGEYYILPDDPLAALNCARPPGWSRNASRALRGATGQRKGTNRSSGRSS